MSDPHSPTTPDASPDSRPDTKELDCAVGCAFSASAERVQLQVVASQASTRTGALPTCNCGELNDTELDIMLARLQGARL